MFKRVVVSAASVALLAAGIAVAAPSQASAARPVVTGLSSSTAPASGGTKLLLSGRNFSKASSVEFGSERGRDMTVLSNTSIRVVTPKHATGRVDVRVRTSAGTSNLVRADRLTFIDPPVISKLSVHGSLPSGGVQVMVTGSGFTGVREVAFGSTDGTHVHVISSHSLQVTAPAHVAGSVDVRILSSGGVSKYGKQTEFTYAVPPMSAITDVPADETDDHDAVYDTACPAGGNCYAVGYDPAYGLPLVESARVGGKGQWMPSTLPLPSNAEAGGLEAISCPSTTQCYAVGSYDTTQGDEVPILEHLVDGFWDESSVELPDGTTDGYLDSIECPTTSTCAMSGTATGSGVLLVTLDSDGETSVLAPAPNGYTAKNLNLDSLDCASATSCVAVSDYLDQAGDDHATSEVFTGSTWVSSAVPVPDNTATSSLLSSVSCLSSKACVAVGRYESPGGATPLISTLDGTTWTSSAGPLPAGTTASDPEQNNSLDAVSCDGTYCEAVGGVSYRGTATALIERSTDGRTWTATAQAGPAGTEPYLSGVSCASATFCAATGTTSVNGGTSAFAVVNRPSGLTNQLVPLPAGVADGNVQIVGDPSCSPGGAFCSATGLTSGGTSTLLTIS